jgi:cytochrome P450
MTTEKTNGKFDEWALVELFGHQKIVGKVTEATLAGGAFLRVDVPEGQGHAAMTRYFGPGAIYSMTPMAEDLARQMMDRFRNEPVSRFDLPQLAEKVQPDDPDAMF